MIPKRYWHEMTTSDFSQSDTSNWIAVLPVAAIEQHGPHLPIYTDTCIMEGLISKLVEIIPSDIPATFLPIQSIGKSNEHISFPGTLTLSWQTATNTWLELGECIHQSGVRKIILISSHGGNVSIINTVSLELRVKFDMLAIATTILRFGQPTDLFSEEEIALGIHGGDIETSLMMHLRPDLVNIGNLQDFKSKQSDFAADYKHLRAYGPHQFGWKAQDLNPNGCVGNATLATPEKGQASLNHMAAEFVNLLQDVNRFEISQLETSK